MPRGRKNAKPIAEQIKEKEEMVQKLQAEIAALKKKEEEQDLLAIKNAIAESGLDIKDVLAEIKDKKPS